MKRTGWAFAALALGIAVGAAVGLTSGAATLVLALALVVLVGALAFAMAVGSAPKSRVPEIVDEQVALIEEPVESNDPIRRALGVGTILTMLIVAADAEGYTLGRPSGIRYLLLGVPVFVLLCGMAVSANRGRLAKTTVADRFLFVYAFCGVVGSIYGRALWHTPDSGTVIFLPMCLGLAHLMVRDPMTAREAERFQQWLIRVAVVFLTFGIVSQTPLWPLATPGRNSFERTFFVAWGVAAAWYARKHLALALLAALSAVMFLQYPAATWVIVTMCGLTTAFATSRLGRRTGGFVLVVFAISLFGVGFTQVQGGGSGLAKAYFSTVGKGDNTRARTQLWKAAEIEIRKSPLTGTLWRGNFTVENRNRAITIFGASTRIEPHNDYLESIVLGGFLGLFIFGGLIVSTNVVVLKRVRRLSDEHANAQRDLLRVLLIGFNAAFGAAAFNPELSKPGSTAVVFLIYAVMMTIRPAGAKPMVLPGRERVGVTATRNGHAPGPDTDAAYDAGVLRGIEPPSPS